MTPNNESIVKSMFKNYLEKNIPGVMALFDPNIVWIEPGAPHVPFAGTYKGLKGIEEMFGKEAEMVSVKSFVPQKYFSNGSQVVVLGEDTAVVKTTGKTYQSEWAIVFSLENGKIIQVQTYMNTVDIALAFQPD